jgi:hypothetical protein
MLKARTEKKKEKITAIREDLMEKFESGNAAPLLDETDVALVAQSQVRLSQREILKLHVKNDMQLSLKQRRQVMGHIQAQRAMHAKEVFLKELAAIGSKNAKDLQK